jgi:hypothetical protein
VFKNGHASAIGERSELPSTFSTEESTERVRTAILDNKRVTVAEMEHHLRINHGSAHGIIEFHKVYERWVPKQLRESTSATV